MPSREDLARIQESQASAARAQIKNQTNKLVAEAQINLVNRAIDALPPPVSAGAKALGNGMYAAFKTPVSAVSNARESQDPAKLVAFMIAFAILKAIWCFIKSLLNPLPIIGSFFPLCNNDPQLVGTDRRTNNAREAARTDSSNIASDGASNVFTTATSAGFATTTRNAINQQSNIPVTTSQVSNMNSGVEGMTFEEFVAKTVVPASLPIEEVPPTSALLGQINQNPTTADIPAQPAEVSPQWQASDKLTEGASYEAYRRLFGL